MREKLIIITPCYNEFETISKSSRLLLKQLKELISNQKISPQSKILFVDDGSEDDTWGLIQKLSKKDSHFVGIRQSRNYGQQSALFAGLMEAKDNCDIVITIDCDGQDDVSIMPEMISLYRRGVDIVNGVRHKRSSDSIAKRLSAKVFYKFSRLLGVNLIYNHADYRLVSNRIIQELSGFKEVNLFLRGLFPLIGFRAENIFYDRQPRVSCKSRYSFRKMLHLALDGITGFSSKPLRLVLYIGILATLLSIVGIIYIFISFLSGNIVSGWTSLALIVCFFGGMQMLSLGIIGEYISRIYLESKSRPRYIISERTYKKKL